MFESLRDAFRQAVVNFRAELNRDAPGVETEPELQAMRREVDRARSRRTRLRTEIARAEAEAEAERRGERTCLRRAELARKIDDLQTAEVAQGFAERHRRRREILEQKCRVLSLELGEHERDLQEMTSRLRKVVPPGVAGPEAEG